MPICDPVPFQKLVAALRIKYTFGVHLLSLNHLACKLDLPAPRGTLGSGGTNAVLEPANPDPEEQRALLEASAGQPRDHLVFSVALGPSLS